MGDPLFPPLVTDPQRSALMARIRQKGTKPELLVGIALRELRVAYRKNARDLPGSPDFVNRLRRWAIFVNGCYWHHHRCRRGTVPKRNREFWTNKFAANRRRDARAIRELRRKGYTVVLVWECEVFDGHAMFAKLSRIAPNGELMHVPRIPSVAGPDEGAKPVPPRANVTEVTDPNPDGMPPVPDVSRRRVRPPLKPLRGEGDP